MRSGFGRHIISFRYSSMGSEFLPQKSEWVKLHLSQKICLRRMKGSLRKTIALSMGRTSEADFPSGARVLQPCLTKNESSLWKGKDVLKEAANL